MFDVIGKKRWFFAISLILTVPGLIFVLMGPLTNGAVGLQFSIDYTGGTVWTVKFEDPAVTAAQVERVLEEDGLDATVTSIGTEGFLEIRTVEVGLLSAPSPSPSPSPAASGSAGPSGSPSVSPSPSPSPSASPSPGASPSASPTPPPGNTDLPTAGKLGEIRATLEETLGPIEAQQSLTTVGAVVSSDLISQALLLILVGSVGIMTWITYRFRDVKFGVTALVALVHDVLVVVGTFAILGTFFGTQIDGLFVTAMLTVIGFSVHDTIVVFDRVRENKARHAGEPFARIVNHSVLQTFGRSITTSLTVVITLTALLIFAGDAIGTFVGALLLGIVSGTYSSIFNASPLLVVWTEYEERKRLRANTARPSRRATA